MARDNDQRFKVGFFDSKHYMADVFAERNANRFSINFHEARLAASTIALAAGCNAVCVFVNDTWIGRSSRSWQKWAWDWLRFAAPASTTSISTRPSSTASR